MRLYLTQHGQALSKDEDPDRPLSETGQLDVHRLAAFLQAADIKVSRVLHSGKTRAQQTAEILTRSLMPQGQANAIEGISPNDPTDWLINQTEDWDQDTLIVGHLPYLARLASQLINRQQDQGIIAFEPGTLACLEKTASGNWEISLVLRPEHLQHIEIERQHHE